MGTKRRIQLAFALVAVIAVGFILYVWFDTVPEPVYGGKPLSHWLLGYQVDDDPAWDDADKAMRQIGTNAIPTLLRLLKVRDTKIKNSVFALLAKQHLVKVDHVPAEKLNFAGAMGFRKLGAAGAGAVPELISIYGRNLSSWSRSATESALDDLAPYSLPTFERELTRRGPREREMIASVLARANAQPASLVPILTKALHDADPVVRATAATGLAGIGTNAQAAIPDLLQLRKDSNADVSRAASYALERITPTAVQ